MSIKNTWQGLIAKIAVAVSLLALISLALDLPEKIKTSYQSLTKSAPPILIKALFANQESFFVSPVSYIKNKGYSIIVWPSVFEIHNVSDKDITITDIRNDLSLVRVNNVTLKLNQISDSDRVINFYDSFEQLTSSNKNAGVVERLPYTVKSGSKKYIKIFIGYNILKDEKILYCQKEETCYKYLVLALGGHIKQDGSYPCLLKSFKTNLELVNYKSNTTDQKAILLVPGCKVDFSKVMDMIRKPE